MMPVSLLEHLASIDVRVSIDGNDLVIDAPEGVALDEVTSLCRRHKADLLAALRSDARRQLSTVIATVAGDERGANLHFQFAEDVAVAEENSLPSADAERLSLDEVRRAAAGLPRGLAAPLLDAVLVAFPGARCVEIVSTSTVGS